MWWSLAGVSQPSKTKHYENQQDLQPKPESFMLQNPQQSCWWIFSSIRQLSWWVNKVNSGHCRNLYWPVIKSKFCQCGPSLIWSMQYSLMDYIFNAKEIYIKLDVYEMPEIFTGAPNVDSSASENSPQQIHYFLLFVWLKKTITDDCTDDFCK